MKAKQQFTRTYRQERVQTILSFTTMHDIKGLQNAYFLAKISA